MVKLGVLTVADYVKVSDNDLLEVMCKADDLRVVLEVVVCESQSVYHHRCLYRLAL